MPSYVEWTQKQSEARIANFLVSKFAEIESSIKGLRQETDPEVTKYKSQIEVLKRKEGFSELDDATLLNVVKALSNSKVKNPRGSIGGQPVRATEGGKFTLTDEERIAMGYAPREKG